MNPVLFIVGMGPGVSAAVARRFAREGFAVGAVARDAVRLEQSLADLRSTGVRVAAATANAGDSAALRTALADLQAQLGPPGVLVYNAAGVTYAPLAELSVEQLAADLSVSVLGAYTAAQAVLPDMIERRSGTILLTGGGFAFEPMPVMASLGVGKAAVRNLAFSLHAAAKDADVHVATVTICGTVAQGTAFDPDRIAEAYWTLHAQRPGEFERELVFRG